IISIFIYIFFTLTRVLCESLDPPDTQTPAPQGKTSFAHQEAYAQRQEMPEHKKAQLSRASPEQPTAEIFTQGPFDL
ncbi:MAG: hypothetical protein ACFN28_01530, partial [Rothia dentocariosa]